MNSAERPSTENTTVTSASTFLQEVTVLVLTWNEEANLERTLAALVRFPQVVILDSGSIDATLSIAARFSNVRVCSRTFDNHASQWNYGLRACDIETDWVLALDADYVLPAELVAEIAALKPPLDVSGYRAAFRYCIEGSPLRGALYPPVTVLYRRAAVHYRQDGHTQRLVVHGEIRPFSARILHDDRKPLSAWLAAQDRYATLEADLIRRKGWRKLGWADRLRRLVVVTPWLVPLYCLVWKRGLLDGRLGLQYALQRGIAESILALAVLRRRGHRLGRDIPAPKANP